MDYGDSSGSKPASEGDRYYPVFHLDMFSVVGIPLCPIVRQGGFFDNVTFTLRLWQSLYRSSHTIRLLSFGLTNRIFRLITGASREAWYIIIYPTNSPVLQSRPDSGQRRKRETHMVLEKHHAKDLAEYIVAVLESRELLMEGVQPSWVLGSCHLKSISFGKWLKFQSLFII